jgi:NitT/TauT family transport system ATP-binding protein
MTTAPQNIVLECRGVSHHFGSKKVLHDICFQVERGQIIALVGRSGCGKTTLLRAMLGTTLARTGEVVHTHLDGRREVVLAPSQDRGIVFQDNCLYPFLTALENVAYGLKISQTSIPYRLFRPVAWRRQRRRNLARSQALLREFSLEDAADCYPRQLSGGMQRRVAIARALIMQPEIVFLDEPFTGLDEETSGRLQRFILRLNLKAKQERGPFAGVTMIIVTHELNAGLTVADRVLGLSQYWDWKAEGFDTCPGAKIVYDAPAPVYGPDDTLNIAMLEEQKREIEEAVSSPEFRESREKFRREWSAVRAQQPTGVLSGVRG